MINPNPFSGDPLSWTKLRTSIVKGITGSLESWQNLFPFSAAWSSIFLILLIFFILFFFIFCPFLPLFHIDMDIHARTRNGTHTQTHTRARACARAFMREQTNKHSQPDRPTESSWERKGRFFVNLWFEDGAETKVKRGRHSSLRSPPAPPYESNQKQNF